MKKHKGDFVRLIGIAEFNIDVGNTLISVYPESARVPAPHFYTHRENKRGRANPEEEKGSSPRDYLCNYALPDGAHVQHEDSTFMILEDPLESGKSLYGMSLFRCARDDKTRRGAFQSAVVIVVQEPFFEMLRPILRAVHGKYLQMLKLVDGIDQDKPRKRFLKVIGALLQTVYVGLNKHVHRSPQLSLWDSEPFRLNIPVLEADQFSGASLCHLLSIFREDTMLLWYAMLLQLRILFCGHPAGRVCHAVLACPLLCAPLIGCTPHMYPYVSLSTLHFMDRPFYIAGTTNPIFETMNDAWDILASFNEGICQRGANDADARRATGQGKLRVAPSDRAFIGGVLAGMEANKGERWVRNQFRQRTLELLHQIEAGTIPTCDTMRQITEVVRRSTKYETYRASRAAHAEDTHRGPAMGDCITQLRDEQLGSLQKANALFHLSKALSAISHVERAVEHGAVELVSAHLAHDSAQVRKWSVHCLASLSVSARAQEQLQQEGVLGATIRLVQDPMLNVALAASECLAAIASQPSGASALWAAHVVAPPQSASGEANPGEANPGEIVAGSEESAAATDDRELPAVVSHPTSVVGLLSRIALNPGEDILKRTRCTDSLLKMFRQRRASEPACEAIDMRAFASVLSDAEQTDPQFLSRVLQLLDACGCSPLPTAAARVAVLPPHGDSAAAPDLASHLDSLRASSDPDQVLPHLNSDLRGSPALVLQFLIAGGVEALLELELRKNLTAGPADDVRDKDRESTVAVSGAPPATTTTTTTTTATTTDEESVQALAVKLRPHRRYAVRTPAFSRHTIATLTHIASTYSGAIKIAEYDLVGVVCEVIRSCDVLKAPLHVYHAIRFIGACCATPHLARLVYQRGGIEALVHAIQEEDRCYNQSQAIARSGKAVRVVANAALKALLNLLGSYPSAGLALAADPLFAELRAYCEGDDAQPAQAQAEARQRRASSTSAPAGDPDEDFRHLLSSMFALATSITDLPAERRPALPPSPRPSRTAPAPAAPARPGIPQAPPLPGGVPLAVPPTASALLPTRSPHWRGEACLYVLLAPAGAHLDDDVEGDRAYSASRRRPGTVCWPGTADALARAVAQTPQPSPPAAKAPAPFEVVQDDEGFYVNPFFVPGTRPRGKK